MKSVRLLWKETWVEKHEYLLLTILIVLAACIIARNVLAHRNGDAFSREDGSWLIAQNLLNGKGYSACNQQYFPLCGPDNQQTAMRPPTPVLLMAFALLFSTSHVAGIMVQGLMYLVTLLIIYASLRDYDRRAGLLAAFLWVISISVIRNIDTDGGDMAAAFFFSAAMFYFQKGRQKGVFLHWLLAGAFFGVASQARSVMLGVLGGLVIGLLWERRDKIQRGLLHYAAPALITLGASGVILAPWVIRNEIVFHASDVSGTLVGYNLYRMNVFLEDNPFVPHYVGPAESLQEINELVEEDGLKGNLNESAMETYYFNAALEIIRAYPARYMLLSLFRFLPLWFDFSVPAAYSLRFGLLDLVAAVEQAVLLIAGLIGAFLGRKRFWPLVLSIVLACGAYMAVDAQLRYLTDVMPAIVIVAALVLPLAGRYVHLKMSW